MDQEFETPDLSEFIAACAKAFCPECGKPIVQNSNGRPKSFCSNRCRWAFNKRMERRKAKEALNENSRVESAAGGKLEASGIQSEKETETRRQGISEDQGLH